MDLTCDVNLLTSQFFISIILGAIVGFLLDSAMASDAGLRSYTASGRFWKKVDGKQTDKELPNEILNEMMTFHDNDTVTLSVKGAEILRAKYTITEESLLKIARNGMDIVVEIDDTKRDVRFPTRHALSQLLTNNFVRYIVTVLIDLFISSILITKIIAYVSSTLSTKSTWTSVAMLKEAMQMSPLKGIIPAICTSVVSLLTFYTYTNDTRFDWAILPTGSTEAREKTMNLLLCGSLCAAAFLSLPVDGISETNKLVLTLGYFLAVTGLYMSKALDSGPSSTADASNYSRGFLVFLTILLACSMILFLSQGSRDPHFGKGRKMVFFLLFVGCFLFPLLTAMHSPDINSAFGVLGACIVLFVAVAVGSNISFSTLRKSIFGKNTVAVAKAPLAAVVP